MHFFEGVRSTSVALKFFPSVPRRVRLMNTGKELRAAIDPLPEYFANGQAQYYLHITGIPVDELANEPIVLEFEW